MGRRIVVVGAGIFGASAALELQRRGDDVTLVDPGPIPHPLAESCDVSKVVRIDYGGDDLYAEMGERSIDRWRAMNAERPDAPLFHETGVTFLSRAPMQPGGFEHESFETLRRRGHAPERLDDRAITRKFPAWNTGRYVDGYFNARGARRRQRKGITILCHDDITNETTTLCHILEVGP